HQREIEQKRYASVRIFTVLATWSSGSSTRSSTVGVWQPATTSSEPTTSHSSSLHPYGCGCALMSPRPSVRRAKRTTLFMRSSFMRSSASLRHCDIAPWPSKAGDKTKPNGLLTEGRFSRDQVRAGDQPQDRQRR